MKNNQLILAVAMLALMAAGCAKENKADVAQTTPAPVVNPTFPVNAPPGQGAGTAGDNWSYGGTTDFKMDSLEIFSAYVGLGTVLNNPTNVKLNVNLMDIGGGKFAGALKIGYDDVNKHHEGYFLAGTGTNNQNVANAAKDVGLPYAEYNYWFQNNKYFSGYFQDTAGAVVLVIDNVVNQGDAQGNSLVSGSVWFKNFTSTFATQGDQRYCWFIYVGPYNCRSTTMMDKSSPYPSDGYRRLGSFSNLVRSKAFNQ